MTFETIRSSETGQNETELETLTSKIADQVNSIVDTLVNDPKYFKLDLDDRRSYDGTLAVSGVLRSGIQIRAVRIEQTNEAEDDTASASTIRRLKVKLPDNVDATIATSDSAEGEIEAQYTDIEGLKYVEDAQLDIVNMREISALIDLTDETVHATGWR